MVTRPRTRLTPRSIVADVARCSPESSVRGFGTVEPVLAEPAVKAAFADAMFGVRAPDWFPGPDQGDCACADFRWIRSWHV
jgi:hypothetical protein